MRKLFVLPSAVAVFAVLACLAPLYAQTPEGNLLKNPGFEDPIPGKRDNPYLNWAFADNGQPAYRGEIEAQDYHTGLQAASISVGPQPKVYASWAQHVRLADDNQFPDQVSLWYRAPQNDAAIVLSFIGFQGDKPISLGGDSIPLPKSTDWTKLQATLHVPAGTRDLQFELRVTQTGEYKFDDVALVRTELAAAGGRPDRILFVGAQKVTYLWQAALQASGWQHVSYASWDDLTPELLKQCRVVVMVALPARPDPTDADLATIKLLDDYVKAGGGLLLNQQVGQIITAMTLPWALARHFGTDIPYELTVSDPKQTTRVGAWGPDTYTYTDQVSGPVADGVKGVLYQSTVDLQSLGGVMPMLPQDPWQVVLSAGPNSHSETYQLGLEEVDKYSRPAGFATNVPIGGIREDGAGRVAYYGMLTDVVFTRPIAGDADKTVHEAYLTKGANGFTSDLQKLYLNTFTWLGAHADKLTAAQLTRPAVAGVQYATGFHFYKGLIGPRTTHSSGASTPDQYVARARAAGYDFIIFMDDFGALKPGGWEALKADCKRLSDGSFLAIPGLTYENTDGNHEFAWGKYLKLPSAKLLSPDGKRFLTYDVHSGTPNSMYDITWLYTLNGFENESGWYLFGKNPYPHFDARDVNAMGVITQQGGKTLEAVVDSYAAEARNGQFEWPLALTLMSSADEIALAQNGTYYHNEVGIEGVQKLDTWLNTLAGRSSRNLFPGAPCFGEVFLTNGPSIDLKMPRGDTDAQSNIYNPDLQAWSFDLKVTSPVGLREVDVMDGTTRIRRFLPRGAKEFTEVTSLPRERQKDIWVRAYDTAGHQAISRDLNCDSWLLRDTQCADRNNQLLYSMQTRPDGVPFFVGYGGDTPMPDKGPWNGRIRPVGIFVFDKKLGAGSMAYDGSPENHPQCTFDPSCWYGDTAPKSLGWESQLVAGKEGAPHVQPYRVSASSDVLVADRILDGVFGVDTQPVIHVWHTLYPVSPSQYLKITARCYLYLVKPDGVSIYLWDEDFEFLQDVPVSPQATCPLRVGYVGASTATQRVIVNAGQVVDSGPVKGKPVQNWAFNPGDYVGLLQSPYGSLAVYSLTNGLVLQGDGVNYGVGFKPETPGVFKKGDHYRAMLMLVGMHRLVDDPASLAGAIDKEYGLSGAPAWKITPQQGTQGVPDYPVQLAASPTSDCFLGGVSGVVGLAGNLGVEIAGLHDNWTAFFQAQGAGSQTRIISVEKGTGYAVIQAPDEGKTLFLGHPLVADNPALSLTVARSDDWKKWVVEIHNPTDKPITATVRSNPYYQGFVFSEKLTLSPGSSVMRELGPAQ